ncbi:MAG: pirin family protein [Bradyrhizobiaceae bacterium]|nr:pirin family protein [Bradyrhizobiaceae bacterium]
MSFFPGQDPRSGDKFSCDALELMIVPRSVDLGDATVRRALPHSTRRTVGPFVFFDHFGPAVFKSGSGLDVRPHPHIGLSTLTYLYDGEIIHRDTLGVQAAIHPGEVNWMTAGRGIVHSERTAPERRVDGEPLHGLQLWIAMPAKDEEIDPSFAHLDGEELPVVEGEGKKVRIVAGRMFGATSPLKTTSETIFADISLDAGATMPLDTDYEERAIYVSSGEIDIAGDRFGMGRLLVFRPGDRIAVKALQPSRIAVVGGAPLDGPRYVWWNFVSSRRERIEQAKEEWKQGRFGRVPGDEIEFIPLPEKPQTVAL